MVGVRDVLDNASHSLYIVFLMNVLNGGLSGYQ